MTTTKTRWRAVVLILFLTFATRVGAAEPPSSWTKYAPRDELLPDFSVAFDEDSNERSQSLVLKISTGERDAIDGAWVKAFPVTGGKHYRFSALRETQNIASPRRSAIVKITWQDDKARIERERPEAGFRD